MYHHWTPTKLKQMEAIPRFFRGGFPGVSTPELLWTAGANRADLLSTVLQYVEPVASADCPRSRGCQVPAYPIGTLVEPWWNPSETSGGTLPPPHHPPTTPPHHPPPVGGLDWFGFGFEAPVLEDERETTPQPPTPNYQLKETQFLGVMLASDQKRRYLPRKASCFKITPWKSGYLEWGVGVF